MKLNFGGALKSEKAYLCSAGSKAQKGRILPGVAEFIERARALGLALGVASSSPRSWVEGHLTHLLLRPHFTVIRCAEDVEHVKPAPDLYFAVTSALGVAPDQTIAIEDSPNGITAAKAAGLYCVSVPNAMTRNLSMDAADLVLVSLARVSAASVAPGPYSVSSTFPWSDEANSQATAL